MVMNRAISTVFMVWINVCFIVCLFNCSSFATSSSYLLDEITINPNALTITSYHLNINSKYSEWVDKIFGSKSVFFSRTESNKTSSSPEPITTSEAENRHKALFHRVVMPSFAFIPKCSIEMLGFVSLEGDPFKVTQKNVDPLLGKATLSISDTQWECFYRPLYENWRGNFLDANVKPNFWAVVFYCPTLNPAVCASQHDPFEENKDKLVGSLLMQYPNNKDSYWRTEVAIQRSVRRRGRKAPPVAICTSMPYLTSDKGKEVANGAILFEWTRYYLNLGVQVIIYDRDANNRNYLFNSSYGAKQINTSTSCSHDLANHPNLLYHNYTVLGLLDAKGDKARYDNADGVSDNLVMYDNDHALTLTQCRFEAKAALGIDTVIVADFDEFLYCPAGGPSPSKQSQYQRGVFRSLKTQGVDQVSFYQRMLSNRTAESMRDCVVRQTLSEVKGSSVLDCFAPTQFTINDFLVKSAHMNHGCPLTGDHSACPLPDRDPRSHDCMCESRIMEDCSMYHLSTRVGDYESEGNTRHAPSTLQGQISELYLIANNFKLPVGATSSGGVKGLNGESL